MLSLHPLRLLTRTDAEVKTIYHSFFFIELSENGAISIAHRIPSVRNELDNIQAGLFLFITEVAENSLDEELYGHFVITSSDGAKYHAFWRGLNHKIFVAVSEIFLYSFTRQLFETFPNDSASTVNSILLSMTEFPIIPISDITYNVMLPNDINLKLSYSSIEQPHDIDMSSVAISLMSPEMLVTAWESIILERKVLVCSSNFPVVPLCCEYLRRLVLPLVIINTYVPFLTRQLINTLEAPFPYLVGAEIRAVQESQIELPDTVIIDLDTRSVYKPVLEANEKDLCAPPNITSELLRDITNLVLNRLGNWVSRSNGSDDPNHPLNNNSVNYLADAIVDRFIRTNLSILTARTTKTIFPTFFRQPSHVTGVRSESLRTDFSEASAYDSRGTRNKKSSLKTVNSDTDSLSYNFGFMRHNDLLVNGMLSLLQERYKDDTIVHTLPCWAEMDNLVFAIYEQVDENPILCFHNKDIKIVSPSAAEPEGHVFELVVGNPNQHQQAFKFAATDVDSRRCWINYIEEKMQQSQQHQQLSEKASQKALKR
jgi:hypothetical protein